MNKINIKPKDRPREGFSEIKIPLGSTLESALDSLFEYAKQGILTYVYFNGVYLYSDTTTWDSAYNEICGMNRYAFLCREKGDDFDKFMIPPVEDVVERSDYGTRLIAFVEAAGEQLMEQSESIVPSDTSLLSTLKIEIDVSHNDSAPYIRVIEEYVVKDGNKILSTRKG